MLSFRVIIALAQDNASGGPIAMSTPNPVSRLNWLVVSRRLPKVNHQGIPHAAIKQTTPVTPNYPFLAD